MPRSALAYLSDIVEACDAVAVALDGVDLPGYEVNRTLRSAVEREFTIIGEAVNSMSRLDPELAARVSHARMIVGFRNQLVHDYAAIIDATVWAIAKNDAPVLRRECDVLIDELRGAP
ncbi:MAG: HepT-like ribonuclease domain-containing protein [Candidatus Aquicultor sp.]